MFLSDAFVFFKSKKTRIPFFISSVFSQNRGVHMIFLFMTFLLISLSIVLIHKLTNFLGLDIKPRALVLCGILAFLVNFVTLSMSAFLNEAHFVRILSFVLLTAGIVTCYNEYLLHQAKAAHAVPIAPEPALPTRHPPETKPIAHRTSTRSYLQDVIFRASCRHLLRLEAARLQASFAARQQAAVSRLPVILHQTVLEQVAQDMENDQLLKITAVLAKLGSLDAILDYAAEQTARHNFSNAIFAYKQALRRYQEDGYAPFIIIDLGNIYKENGAYDEAIQVYQGAFSLPAVIGSDAMQEAFQKNADYLCVVKYILTKHNACKTPFASIPKAYLQEIEACCKHRRIEKLYFKTQEE